MSCPQGLFDVSAPPPTVTPPPTPIPTASAPPAVDASAVALREALQAVSTTPQSPLPPPASAATLPPLHVPPSPHATDPFAALAEDLLRPLPQAPEAFLTPFLASLEGDSAVFEAFVPTDCTSLPQARPHVAVAGVEWDARLAMEIAQGLEQPAHIAARWGLTLEQWQVLATHKPFLLMVKRYALELRTEGVTFRLRAKACAEDVLSDAYVLAKAKQTHPDVKLKAIQWLARMADYEPREFTAGQQSGGFAVAIQITNERADRGPVGAIMTGTVGGDLEVRGGGDVAKAPFLALENSRLSVGGVKASEPPSCGRVARPPTGPAPADVTTPHLQVPNATPLPAADTQARIPYHPQLPEFSFKDDG